MLTSSFISDEDNFSQRLEHINREMKAIMDRTGVERSQLLNMEARSSVMRNLHDGFRIGGVSHTSFTTPLNTTPPVSLPPGPTSSHDISEDITMKRMIDERVGELRGSFAQMLSDTISSLNLNIQQRFDDAQRSRLDFTESLRETADTARRSVSELQTAFSRMKRTVDRPVEELARELQEHVSRSNQENTRVRDAIASLENEARVERQRGDRRIDELVRRHHDLVRNSLLELDAHVDGLRDELQAMVRLQSKQVMEELSSTQQQVARLHGALEAMNDTTVRWVAELRDLMEENAKRRSEMQSLKGEVDNLGALVKQLSNQLTTIAKGSTPISGEGGHNTPLRKSSSGVEGDGASPETIKALKYTVNCLASDMTRMGRQMAYMNGALQKLFASHNAGSYGGANGNGRFPPPVSGASHGRVGDHGYGGRPTSMNSSNSPQFPFPYGGTSAGTREFQHPHMMGSRSLYSGGLPGFGAGTNSPPAVHASTTDASPMSAYSPRNCSPSYSMGEAQQSPQQQEPSPTPEQCRVNNSESASPKHSVTQNKQTSPDEDERAPSSSSAFRCGEVDSPLNVASTHSQNHSSSHHRGSPIQANTTSPGVLSEKSPAGQSTPPDSYVSSRNSVVLDRRESRQYNPAPTSDLESELDNKKIARLALD